MLQYSRLVKSGAVCIHCSIRHILWCCFAVLMVFNVRGATETVAADNPPDFVPLGAYMSWQRPKRLAAYRGIDHWTDVCERLDALKAASANMLWVSNMVVPDLPRLVEECRIRDFRLIAAMANLEVKVDWRWSDGGAYYDRILTNNTAAAGNDDTLIGWCLSDEPRTNHFSRLEQLRCRLRKQDPGRFSTAVTMWQQTPGIPHHTGLPVICVDPYAFFAPNDPNGPHTDKDSTSFFRRHVGRMIEAIGDRNRVGWVMGMCFSEIWGPRKYNKQGHLIGLPGAYLHWRCPTLAEMRWQVWETFRGGAKGYISYTLSPETPDPARALLPPPDVTWSNVLAKVPTDLGPNALTTPDGSRTPQFEELGKVYCLLTPHLKLIRHWRKVSSLAVDISANGGIQLFKTSRENARFAIVINNDLHREQDIHVRFAKDVAMVTDITRNKQIPMGSDMFSGNSSIVVKLAPGDGAILMLKQ